MRGTPARGSVRDRQGFTIVELVMVLLVLTIAAGQVFPSMAQAWEQLSVRGAMDELRSAHQKARTAAVRYGRVTELHIDATNHRVWVEMDTTLASSGVMDTVGAVVDLTEHKVEVSTTAAILCFDARGLVAVVSGCPSSGSATFTLTRGDTSDTFVTTSGGVPWEIG